jgi:Ras-related protein Rab-1A
MISLNISVSGDKKVGKTSILYRLCNNEFTDKYVSTLGVEFKSRTYCYRNSWIKLNFWDVFHSSLLPLDEEIDGSIIVFDLENIASLFNLSMHINKIKKYNPDIPIIIVANKCDKSKQISRKDITTFLKSYNLTYIETSAKKDYNIRYMLDATISIIIENMKQNMQDDDIDALLNPKLNPELNPELNSELDSNNIDDEENNKNICNLFKYCLKFFYR